MARGKPVVLETREFNSRSDAKKFFRGMLNRYEIGDTLVDVDGAELSALLALHSEVADKIGVGVHHFEVGIAEMYGTKCFWIVRLDGSREQFSYLHCLKVR